jgi:hypothetical protein
MPQLKDVKSAKLAESRGSKRNIFRGASGLFTACALILSSGFPLKARADVTDELLEIMKKKGDLTEAQYKDLKARHELEKASYQKTEKAAQKKAAPDKDAVPVALKKGVDYTDPPAPAPSLKDGGLGSYVTALPKGVGIRIGNYEFETKGDISFFGVEDFPQRRLVNIGGGLLSSGLHNDSNSIRAGLLPSSLQFEVRTSQYGWDAAAHFGIYVGGNSNALFAIPPNPTGLGQSDIDFRQVYGTVGNSYVGTFKFGRDLGIFGAEAILYDATIFGAGTPQGNWGPGNTTLGRIGVGYVYADWIPQISWTSPDWNGFTVSAGIFTPLNDVNIAGLGNSSIGIQIPPGPFASPPQLVPFDQSATITGKDSPMVQGRLKYVGNFGGSPCGLKDAGCSPCGMKDAAACPGLKLTAWTSALFQDHQLEHNIPVTGAVDTPLLFGRKLGDSISSWAVDGGVKVDWAGFSVLGYAYTGEGLGTTALFWNAVSINGDTRWSSGGYAQASYTFWDTWTVGGSWGISQLGFNSAVDDPHLQKQIWSAIGFVQYKLTDWVKFQVEYVHTEEENHLANGRINDDAVIAGTTFFW